MSYTIKNLKEVKDSAPQFDIGHALEARFASEPLDSSDTGVTLMVVKPGERIPFGHRHNKAEEVYVVVSGSGRFKLDDEFVEVSKFDAVRIAPAVARGTEAGPDGLEYIAVGPRHEGDGEMIQDFWDQ